MADENRRSYGTGSLYVRKDAKGRESWYGRWRVGDQRLRRLIGPKRQSGSRDGLTRAQAERELSRQIDRERGYRHVRVTVEEAGRQLLAQLEALGRKPTTINTYRSLLRTHLSRSVRPLSIGSDRMKSRT